MWLRRKRKSVRYWNRLSSTILHTDITVSKPLTSENSFTTAKEIGERFQHLDIAQKREKTPCQGKGWRVTLSMSLFPISKQQSTQGNIHLSGSPTLTSSTQFSGGNWSQAGTSSRLICVRSPQACHRAKPAPAWMELWRNLHSQSVQGFWRMVWQ